MATKFPKFSQALAQDPATRRIWYGIATAHDLEAHDGMTEENLYQKILYLWGSLFKMVGIAEKSEKLIFVLWKI